MLFQFDHFAAYDAAHYRVAELLPTPAGPRYYHADGVPKTEAEARQAFLSWVLSGILLEIDKGIAAGIFTENACHRLQELFPEILAEKLLRNSTGISPEISWINCCGVLTAIPGDNSHDVSLRNSAPISIHNSGR